MPKKKIEQITDLQLDAGNLNGHTERGSQLLRRSLENFGGGRGVVVDKNGTVVAGNSTITEALELGMPIEIVNTTGERLVVIQRDDFDLSDPDNPARLYSLYDNRTGEMGLRGIPERLLELKPMLIAGPHKMFNVEEFFSLTHKVMEQAVSDPGDQRNQSAVHQEAWGVQPGDIWQITGRATHTLMCGDSENLAHVAALLGEIQPVLCVTDPPYAVKYDPAWRNRELDSKVSTGQVLNDSKVDWRTAYELSRAAVLYVWHAGVYAGEVAESINAAGYDIRSQIIWVKDNFAVSRGHYHWMHEPCYYAVKRGATGHWKGDRKQRTVWEVQVRPSVVQKENHPDAFASGHGTQKPVELWARAYNNHLGEGDCVYDPFAGSGSCFVAGEQLVFNVYGMELNPAYCASVLARLAASGAQPQLLHRAGDIPASPATPPAPPA